MQALRSPDVLSVIDELGARWNEPAALAGVSIGLDRRLRSALGRADARSGRIAIAPRVLDDPSLLREVLTHELAHVVAFERVGADERAHGPTWSSLMRSAGLESRPRIPGVAPARVPRRAPPPVYVYRCPVCHATRRAKRPMSAWRCVDCSAAGLPGTLEIDRRLGAR